MILIVVRWWKTKYETKFNNGKIVTEELPR